jgi:hypothetical protein
LFDPESYNCGVFDVETKRCPEATENEAGGIFSSQKGLGPVQQNPVNPARSGRKQR